MKTRITKKTHAKTVCIAILMGLISIASLVVVISLISVGITTYNHSNYRRSHIPLIKRVNDYHNATQHQIQTTNVHKALQTHTIYSPTFRNLMYKDIANFHSDYLDTNDEKDNMTYQGLLFNHRIVQSESLAFDDVNGNSNDQAEYQTLTYTEIKHGVIDSTAFITNHSTPKTLTLTTTATKSPIHKIMYKLTNVKYNHHDYKNYTKLILEPVKVAKNKDTHLKLIHIHKDLILTENKKLRK